MLDLDYVAKIISNIMEWSGMSYNETIDTPFRPLMMIMEASLRQKESLNKGNNVQSVDPNTFNPQQWGNNILRMGKV